MAEPEEVIDIRDAEVNVEEIMGRIRERIRQRRGQAQAQGLDYDRLVDGGAGRDVAGRRLSVDFYYDLYQARQSAETIWVSLSVVGQRSPAFLGSAVSRVRRAAHELVLYYVNMLAGRQAVFNRSAVSAVSGLAASGEEMGERLEALEEEAAVLRERIAVLERSQTITDANG
ncbi:MAG: hypothetical protein HY328_02740 [Chloroflexi bacterium]|nr:hypothetical protein [Chloroflexota bacterium]